MAHYDITELTQGMTDEQRARLWDRVAEQIRDDLDGRARFEPKPLAEAFAPAPRRFGWAVAGRLFVNGAIGIAALFMYLVALQVLWLRLHG